MVSQYKPEIVRDLVLCATRQDMRIKYDYRKTIAKEMVAAGLIERVSGTKMITYKVTHKGYDAILDLSDDDIKGFYPRSNDILHAKWKVLYADDFCPPPEE